VEDWSIRSWEDDPFDEHPAFSAVRADRWIDAGESPEPLLPGDGLWLMTRGDAEYPLGLREFRVAIPVTEDAVVPDLDEAVGEHVKQESSDELACLQGHEPDLIMSGAVTPAEYHLMALESDQAIVGNGDSMYVSGQILDDIFGSSHRGLAMNHPGLTVQTGEEPHEGSLMIRVSEVIGDLQSP
jgi:hypothetical protein